MEIGNRNRRVGEVKAMNDGICRSDLISGLRRSHLEPVLQRVCIGEQRFVSCKEDGGAWHIRPNE